jgi:hypothetical protein
MRIALHLFVAQVAVLAALPLSLARAEPSPSSLLFFTYQSAQGPGVLSLEDVGPGAATGSRQIWVTLTQNGYCSSGPGTTRPLEQTAPYRTLITFTLAKLHGPSYVYQGTLISGITLSGQGTYHRDGKPEKSVGWSVVLGVGPAASSGIRGIATAGPIFPHEIPGVENRRPLANALLIVQAGGSGKEVARQRTDANGRFQMPLRPGTYRVVPLPPDRKAPLPRAEAFMVVVQQGEYTELVIDYETGIR